MAEKEEESVEEVEVDPIPDPGGIMERVPKGWDHPDGSKKQKLISTLRFWKDLMLFWIVVADPPSPLMWLLFFPLETS